MSHPVRFPQAVIRALDVACKAHPEQRSGQILFNAVATATVNEGDIFYMEDAELAKALYEYAKKDLTK